MSYLKINTVATQSTEVPEKFYKAVGCWSFVCFQQRQYQKTERVEKILGQTGWWNKFTRNKIIKFLFFIK